MTSCRALLAFGLLAACLFPRPASAAQQDEIQVYADEINKPGEFTLEMHINGTPNGIAVQRYKNEYLTNGGLRLSPEFAYGLTRDIELGAYVPEGVIDKAGNGFYAGSKIRVKYLPFQPDEEKGGFFAGVNVELSSVDRRILESRAQTEVRFISGYKCRDWIIAFDPIFDWSMSHLNGGDTPDFNFGIKATHELVKGIDIGAEYYSDIGPLNHTYSWNQQDNRIYGVIDVDLKPFVFNLGVGYGLTDASDRLTIKAIWDVPLHQ